MDRYFTIRFPFRYGRNKTRRIMLFKIIAVWTISTAISSPIFILGTIDQQNVVSNGVCAPNNPSFKLYGSIFAFYIPFIIMITTYALTMCSLRNALVNKRKHIFERRLKQTFQPLAQITNQYVEIARNIRHISPINNQKININKNNSSISNSTSYTLIITTSSMNFNQQNCLSIDSDLDAQQVLSNIQCDSINMTNRISKNDELGHNLVINRIEPYRSEKEYYYQQQQPMTMNTGKVRTNDGFDMRTSLETSEYSKSASSLHNLMLNIDNYVRRKSNVINEQQKEQTSKIIDSTEQQPRHKHTPDKMATTASTINIISSLDEDISLIVDVGSESKFYIEDY